VDNESGGSVTASARWLSGGVVGVSYRQSVRTAKAGEPLTITLGDGSRIFIVALGRDEYAVDYVDENGSNTLPGSVQSIMHGGAGIKRTAKRG